MRVFEVIRKRVVLAIMSTEEEKLAELSAFAGKLRAYEKMSLVQIVERLATLEAEIAGEWNAAIEAAAKAAYQCEDYGSDAGEMIADQIRALRRPDAASANIIPAGLKHIAGFEAIDPHKTKGACGWMRAGGTQEATPSVEEVARTICCPSGQCRAEESGRPYKCNWQGETEEAAAVLALFKERS